MAARPRVRLSDYGCFNAVKSKKVRRILWCIGKHSLELIIKKPPPPPPPRGALKATRENLFATSRTTSR